LYFIRIEKSAEALVDAAILEGSNIQEWDPTVAVLEFPEAWTFLKKH
jgi:hypothetical protein